MRRCLKLHWQDLVVTELVLSRGLILAVVNTFLIDMAWLGQVTFLSHHIDHLQISLNLVDRGHWRPIHFYSHFVVLDVASF